MPRTTDPTEPTATDPDDSVIPAETDPTIAEDRDLDDGDELDDLDGFDEIEVDTEVVIWAFGRGATDHGRASWRRRAARRCS